MNTATQGMKRRRVDPIGDREKCAFCGAPIVLATTDRREMDYWAHDISGWVLCKADKRSRAYPASMMPKPDWDEDW